MKRIFAFLFVLIFALSAFAQTGVNPSQTAADLTRYGVKIEPDKRLIAVMSALEFAGFETSLTGAGNDFRSKLKTDFANVNPDLRQKMQMFVGSYIEKAKNRNPKVTNAQLTAPFISLAYTLGGAPDFASPAKTEDLPEELFEVLDFAPLVREFYSAANLEAKMPVYLQMYKTEGEKMRGSAAGMVKNSLDYLRVTPELTIFERVKSEIQDPKNKNKKLEVTKPVERQRRFFIVPELLAPTGAINFRNIGDDYFVIIPPATDLRFSEAGRAYLQYVLDPLILKNGKEISGFRENIKQLLDARRKENPNISPDVFLAVSRSLVAAVDARQIESLKTQIATDAARAKIDSVKTIEEKKAVSAKLEADKRSFTDDTALELSNAYERGAVLAFYFAEQLKGLESSGFNISSSLRDIILSLDTTKEFNRLAEFSDARTRALANKTKAVSVTDDTTLKRAQTISQKLTEIEVVTARKDFPEAETQLKKLLEEFPGESRIYYSLGRVASLYAQSTFDEGLRDKRLEDARLQYSNAINQATKQTDPALIQISHIALGRIFEFYEDKAAALQEYQKAEKIGAVEGGEYTKAKAAVERLTKNP